MKIRLGDLVSARSGFTLRRESKKEAGEEYRVVQIRHISEDGTLHFESPTRLKLDCLPKQQLLFPGEVLLVAKGAKPRAAVFIHNDQPTIASSQLFVLRPGDGIRADYLSWFLNQPDTTRFFEANMAGSRMPFLSLEVLRELKLPVPPLEIQEKIAAINELSIQEQKLLETLRDKRRQLMELSLQHLLQQGERHT